MSASPDDTGRPHGPDVPVPALTDGVHDDDANPVPVEILSEYVRDPGEAQKRFFFEPVLLRRILTLGLPVIIGMLTQTLINQVDTIFVGHLDEKTAVAGTAALGFSVILVWAFGGFLSAISVGTQALTARRYGEGDVQGAGKVLANSAALAVVSAVVVTGIAIALVEPIFNRFHSDPDVRRLGIAFSQVRLLGILPMVLTASFKSFYDGIGMVRVHMTVAIVMNIINLVLCYALVFGNWGAPRLEVEGAAWAAVLSSSAGAILMVLWSMRKADRNRFGAFRLKNLNARIALTVARLSVWSGLATVFVMTGFGLFFVIVGRIDEREGLGGVNAAATQLIISVTMLIFMTCIAFGTSTATLVSQSMGAKKPDLAARYGWQSVVIMSLIMGVVGLLMASFPEPVLRFFMPEEVGKNEAMKDAVIAIASRSLRFCGLIAPIAAAALVLTQALYGAGESRFVMIAEGLLHITCLVPLAYVFAIVMNLGLIGCWYATAVYGLALLVATAIKFYGGSWKKTVL
jgi:MATE family multidrug resistance protein